MLFWGPACRLPKTRSALGSSLKMSAPSCAGRTSASEPVGTTWQTSACGQRAAHGLAPARPEQHDEWLHLSSSALGSLVLRLQGTCAKTHAEQRADRSVLELSSRRLAGLAWSGEGFMTHAARSSPDGGTCVHEQLVQVVCNAASTLDSCYHGAVPAPARSAHTADLCTTRGLNNEALPSQHLRPRSMLV